jgi:hypothetical protein
MSFTARLRLAVAGETMFPPRIPLLPESVGNLPIPAPAAAEPPPALLAGSVEPTPVPHTPPPEAHGLEGSP